MSDNVVQMFKADDAAVALDNAKLEMVAALAIGYNSAGELVAYAGGLIDGKRPVQKDWLWLVESFKATKLNLGED